MTALSPADRALLAAIEERDAYTFRTNMPGVNYDPFDGIVNDRRVLLGVIDRLEARIAALEGALDEALDLAAGLDFMVDQEFRISSDPPCEDEATIARLRASLAQDAEG